MIDETNRERLEYMTIILLYKMLPRLAKIQNHLLRLSDQTLFNRIRG